MCTRSTRLLSDLSGVHRTAVAGVVPENRSSTRYEETVPNASLLSIHCVGEKATDWTLSPTSRRQQAPLMRGTGTTQPYRRNRFSGNRF